MIVADVIGNLKERIIQEPERDQESHKKKTKKSPLPSSKVKDEYLKGEILKAKVMVWYVDDATTPMNITADRIEGGRKKFNIRHLYDIVELAFRHGKALGLEPIRNLKLSFHFHSESVRKGSRHLTLKQFT